MLLPRHAISQKYKDENIIVAVTSRTSSNKSKNIYVSRTEAIESVTSVWNTVGSITWVLTFAGINKKCVLIKMSRVGIIEGSHRLKHVCIEFQVSRNLHQSYTRRNMHHETQKSMHASPRVSTCVGSLSVRTSLSATYTQAPTHNHIGRYLLNVHKSSNLSRRPFPDEMRSFDFIWQMHASVHAVTRTHANEIVFAAVQEHTGKQDSYAAAVSRCTFEPLDARTIRLFMRSAACDR